MKTIGIAFLILTLIVNLLLIRSGIKLYKKRDEYTREYYDYVMGNIVISCILWDALMIPIILIILT